MAEQAHAGEDEHETQTGRQRKKLEEYQRDYERLAATELPQALGFSARLNMLWDLADAAPSRIEGRVLGILAINPAWREVDVRKWLQRDALPPPLDLHNMVRFLVAQLEGYQDPRQWEAFLIYGSPTVTSPVKHVIYRQDQNRRHIAGEIFAEITAKYNISPTSYDAETVFQRCLALMQKFNIYEVGDFQPGHLEPFRSHLFPDE